MSSSHAYKPHIPVNRGTQPQTQSFGPTAVERRERAGEYLKRGLTIPISYLLLFVGGAFLNPAEDQALIAIGQIVLSTSIVALPYALYCILRGVGGYMRSMF